METKSGVPYHLEIGRKWYVILVWTPRPIQDNATDTQREYALRAHYTEATEALVEATGFPTKKAFELMKKAKDYGCTVIRRQVAEVCERTRQVLERRGFKVMVFPE